MFHRKDNRNKVSLRDRTKYSNNATQKVRRKLNRKFSKIIKERKQEDRKKLREQH